MNAMMFKLDLLELVLVVDVEQIHHDDHAVFIKPRSESGRRSQVWWDWEGVIRHQVKQLCDCLSYARLCCNSSIRGKIS